MRLCAIFTCTGTVPENTSTPVVKGSVTDPSNGSPGPAAWLPTLFSPIAFTDDPVAVQILELSRASVCACIVTPESSLPAMQLPSTRLS
jgi:hypothetical protein